MERLMGVDGGLTTALSDRPDDADVARDAMS
jgi:hypothetical protein